MSIAEHGYTLRGGPFNDLKRNYSGFEDYLGPKSDHGPFSKSCSESHEEHITALLDFPIKDYHWHEYDFGADHPDDLNYAGTRYVSAADWKTLSISGTNKDPI